MYRLINSFIAYFILPKKIHINVTMKLIGGQKNNQKMAEDIKTNS